MIFINNKITDVYFNLSLEEYIFEKFKKDDIFIIWRNEPSVIIGKHQNLPQEVNMKYCYDNKIKIARRISGGGTVFHDFGNVNYSYIADSTGDTTTDFKECLKPMYRVLKNLGIDISISERNDFRINDKKICGHSQFVRKKRILHHGCILFDANLQDLRLSLDVKNRKFICNCAKSVPSKVTNIKEICNFGFDSKKFLKKIENEIYNNFDKISLYELSDEDIEKTQKLSEEKYSKKDWIYGQSPKSKLILDENFGILDVNFGKITETYGDEILKNFIGNYIETGEILSVIDEKKLIVEENYLIEKLINM